MSRFRGIIPIIITCLTLPSLGCGHFRRNQTNSSVSSSIEINQQGRDIATLSRDQYEVIEASAGESKSRHVFILTIPVGSQNTASENTDNAYFNAVDAVPGCDAMLNTRVETQRRIIPLLLINIVTHKTRVKGRCVHIHEDDVLAGAAPRQGVPVQAELPVEVQTEVQTEVQVDE